MGPISVVFDIQHGGQPSAPTDRGASGILDGTPISELELVRKYVWKTASLLTSHHPLREVVILDPGSELVSCSGFTPPPPYTQLRAVTNKSMEYGERHEWSARYAREHPDDMILYIACHANSVSDKAAHYTLVEYDVRSDRGAYVADVLSLLLSGPNRRARRRGLGSADRGWSCLDGIYSAPGNLVGVVLEPGFISHEPDVTWMLSAVFLEGLASAITETLKALYR